MRSSLGEPLTVEDIARTALFSKFHFTRIFEQVTGVSPAGSCRRCGYRRPNAC
ncbi:helix-turn-helix transcriptional regulator [Dactylosporangium cerinum]